MMTAKSGHSEIIRPRPEKPKQPEIFTESNRFKWLSPVGSADYYSPEARKLVSDANAIRQQAIDCDTEYDKILAKIETQQDVTAKRYAKLKADCSFMRYDAMRLRIEFVKKVRELYALFPALHRPAVLAGRKALAGLGAELLKGLEACRYTPIEAEQIVFKSPRYQKANAKQVALESVRPYRLSDAKLVQKLDELLKELDAYSKAM